MVNENNKYDGEERRQNQERRDDKDRRGSVRFKDDMGRRTGEERRASKNAKH